MTQYKDPLHHCRLCSFSPFCYPKEKTISQAISIKQDIHLSAKQNLVQAGNPLSSFYIVYSGLLIGYQLNADGKEHIAQFYLPGEVLGFEALSDGKFPYNIRAGKETILCKTSYDDLRKSISKDPELQNHILKLSSSRLRRNILFTHSMAEEKLLDFLKELAQRLHHHEAEPEFTFTMTRQDIGNYLGLAGETISRVFARLQKSKKIVTSGKKIKILSR